MKASKIYCVEFQGQKIVEGRPIGRVMRELHKIQDTTGCYLQGDYFTIITRLRVLPIGHDDFIFFGASLAVIVTCEGEKNFNI